MPYLILNPAPGCPGAGIERKGREMKEIRIKRVGNYTHHGIGYTEHDGYGGTADNRMSIISAMWLELRCIKPGEI